MPPPGKRPEKMGSSGPTYMPPMPPGRPPMPAACTIMSVCHWSVHIEVMPQAF